MKGLLKEISRLVFAVGRLGVLVFGCGHAFVGMYHYWSGDALASINNLALGLVFFVLLILNWMMDKQQDEEKGV